jgi:hypothetical protein
VRARASNARKAFSFRRPEVRARMRARAPAGASLQRARADSPTWRRSRYVASSRSRARVSLALSRAPPAARAIDAHALAVSASQDPASAKADEEKKDWTHAYADDLKTDIYTEVNADPKATVHSTEWRKIMRGDPVEINPSVGSGLKIMTVDEWTSRWKRNDRFPECLACDGTATKEHHFMQTWCRGKKQFESETLCMDCHMFSWRSYSDPDFMLPEEYDKVRWEKMVRDKAGADAGADA